MTKDVTFAEAAPRDNWNAPQLDVYAPIGATALPLLVIFPAHGLSKSAWPVYVDLANALAASGAVVAVANWSETGNGPEATTDPAVALPIIDAGQAMAACAVAYMVDHAAEYGADASRLGLFGHFYGANTAVMVALNHPEPLAGCHGSATDWSVTAAGGWDGDWIGAYPAWDAYGADAAQIVAVLTPWLQLATARPMGVLLAGTAYALRSSARCDDPDSPTTPWLSWRDPHGVMRAGLEAIDAFADRCLDSLDSSTAMVNALIAHGFDARSIYLPLATHSAQSIPASDIELMASQLFWLLEDPRPT